VSRTPVRVVVVDDQAMIRSALVALLRGAGVDVVGEAADGAAALALVDRALPDVVLMDIRMPVLDGLEATRQLRVRHPEVAVVVLTTFDLDAYVFQAVRAGACGFLLKDGDADDLVEAVHAAARGDVAVTPRALRRLLAEFAASPVPDPRAAAAVQGLTEREREVLVRLAQGRSNAELAADLHIGEGTAKTHVSAVLAKLGVRDRVQAVVAAYESGLVQAGR
jgi:DNA-binding NarL/FixJ family response regulator